MSRANATAKRKHQQTAHLKEETNIALQQHCLKQGVSVSLAIDDALQAALFPEKAANPGLGAAAAPDLSGIETRLDALAQQLSETRELMALAMLTWFLYGAPELSETEYRNRLPAAKARFDRFMDTHILRLARGDSLIARYQATQSDTDWEGADGSPQ